RADRAVVLAARDAEPHHAPAVDHAYFGRNGPVGARPDRRRAAGRRERHEAGAKISVALCPPNPNEFDRAGAAGTGRGVPATTSSGMSSPMLSGWGAGGTASSRIASRQATASAAPAAPIMCPVTPFVDVTGGADSPNTLRIASASAASLSGVDVPCAL